VLSHHRTNPVGATTYRGVIGPDERVPTDETIHGQRASELVPALPTPTDWLELDLVLEELPEHLTRLGDLAPEDILDAVDLVTEVGLDPVRVEVGDLQHPGESFRLGRQAVLTGLLGVELLGDLVLRK